MSVSKHFTLVEMLVVIAIISLMAAMLMPSLQQAIEAGIKVSCAQNQRQVAIGVFAYAGDNNSLLPMARTPEGRNYVRYRWETRADKAKCLGYLIMDMEGTALNNKYATVDVLLCPSTGRPFSYGVPATTWELGLQKTNKMFKKAEFFTYPNTTKKVPWNVLTACHYTYSLSGYDYLSSSSDLFPGRTEKDVKDPHLMEGVNVLNCDSSVRWRPEQGEIDWYMNTYQGANYNNGYFYSNFWGLVNSD